MKKYFIFSLLAFSSLTWAGQWRALIVGANNYTDKDIPTLYGAENDLAAIDRALSLPKGQKTVLRGKAATYDAIKNWWEKAIANAKKGDVIFFSFSGHGAKEKEHFAGSEADGAHKDRAEAYDDDDEVFVLPNYFNRGKASRERIIDNEVLAWAKRATDKGATVFVVADACYGGGGTRNGGSGKNYNDPLAVSRNANLKKLEPELDTKRGTKEDAFLRVLDSGTFHNRFFYAIPHFNELEKVNEVTLDGKRHGVLSYLIAEVFSGRAKTSKGKPVRTATEIEAYIQSAVSSLNIGEQSPALIGVNGGNKDTLLVPTQSTTASRPSEKPANKPQASKPQPEKPAAIYSIYVENGDKNLGDGGKLFAPTNNAKLAAYRWNRQRGEVIKGGVGVVGFDIKKTSDLHNFLLQQQAVESILKLPIPRFTGMIVPKEQTDLRHSRVSVFENKTFVMFYLAWPSEATSFVVVNIPSHGGVQLVTTSEGKMRSVMQPLPPRAENGPFTMRLGPTDIVPPFGSDTLLFIGFKNTNWMNDPYFKLLLRDQHNTTDGLLKYLRNAKKGEIKMAVVPFMTAP